MPITNLRIFPTKNYLINSDFRFWQRGSSFSTPASNTYTADRFVPIYDGTIGTFTISQQAFTVGQATVPDEPQFFYRWNQTVAGSASTIREVHQKVENVRLLAGKQVTVTFWAQADSARTLGVYLAQNFGSGGSAQVAQATQNVTLGATFAQYSVTFTLPSISGKTLGTAGSDFIDVVFALPLNTTMTIDLAQVQLNEGPYAAPWELYSGGKKNFVGELIACQRYYEKSYDVDIAPATVTTSGQLIFAQPNNAAVPYGIFFKVRKRNRGGTSAFYSPSTGTVAKAFNTTNGDLIASGVGQEFDQIGISVAANGSTNTTVTVHYTTESELF